MSADASDLADKKSPVEVWKAEKHGFDVWPDVLRHAAEGTPMSRIPGPDLERMKWYGFFYRKNNDNNHYMVRVRIPGCEMTAEQARALATIAYQSGYNILDVTTRGNVQIQGLTVEDLPAVRTSLERVGLTSRQSGHDNVRNVTSHPWSGFDPEELVDTRGLATDIQEMLIGDPELADLPRKVNVALTGRPEAPAHAWTQDISYVAARGPDGTVGFHLLVAGTQGQSPHMAWHLPVFVRPAEVVEVTRALLRAFRELGHRHNRQQVRMRYLVERIGADGMLFEVEKRLGRELLRFPKPVPRAAGREESFVGWKAQKQDGLFALGVCVPVGRLTAEELDGLSAVARQFGDGTLRTTYDQGLVLPGIAEAAREEAAYAVARYGLTFEPDPASRSMVACTGKQFCNIAVIETKGYAYRLIEELRRRRVQLHGIRIAMSGCPSNCANGFTADIGLKGLKVRRGLRVLDAFDVFLGGGLGEELTMAALHREGVPFGELPDAIEAVVREFHLQRNVGETFTSFWQRKLRRHEPEAPKADLPRWQCTRCDHLHVAQDPPPFCPICAAVRAKFEPAPEAGEPPPTPPVTRPLPSGRRILIVGGGIAGHIAARTARARDAAARISLLSDESSFSDFGPEWYDQHQIALLAGARAIALDPVRKAVVLGEGRELEYDTLVLAHGATGVEPNVGWLKRAGIRCGRGVLVDEGMRTSAPDVFAAGDVCEWRGQVAGSWANAEEQAKVAGTNAAGGAALYEGVLPTLGEIPDDSAAITSTVVEDAV